MIAQLSVFPIGEGVSLSEAVARVLRVIQASGVVFRLTAMGTVLEGEVDEIFELVKKIRQTLLAEYPRIYLTLTLDERRDKKATADSKVAAVEKIIGKKLS